MSRNLSNLYISESFQYLVQESGSFLQTGLGSNLTGSLLITASLTNNATTASYATTAASATSASYAVTASYAENAGATTIYTGDGTLDNNRIVDQNGNDLTFKTNGGNFYVTLQSATDQLKISGSDSINIVGLANTAKANVLGYDTTTGRLTYFATSSIAGGGSTDTGSLLTTASFSDAQITFTKGDGSTFNGVINNVTSSISASYATAASTATSASYATTASYAENVSTPDLQTVTDQGNSTTNAISASGFFTAGNAVVLGTASIGFLNVTYESASVIYSSGSNQFGDASNDTQTLYGTVDILTGPLNVSGSGIFHNGITGSLQGNADTATSASFVNVTNNGSDVNSNYVTFVTANGYTTPHTDTSLQFVPSTNTLSATNINATTFTGTLSGNASTATSASYAATASVLLGTVTSASYAQSATSASYINTLGADDNVNYSVAFINEAEGENYKTLRYDGGSQLQYNPSTDTLTTTNVNATASYARTASYADNFVIGGQVIGNVNTLSIVSETASLDCSTGNFFTLTLVSGSTTYVNPSNITAGQTINLKVKQASVASGSINFPSSVLQVSESLYTPTSTANAEDIVTFISFDASNLYLSNVKNLV